jgi:sigma-B regulation protein RsbU (phosphoserine phosphatase)
MATRGTIELDKFEYLALLKRMKFFQSISRDISSRRPLNQLLDEIISASKKLLNSEAASLLIYNKELNTLYFHTLAGNKSASLKSQTLKMGEGIGGWVAAKKDPLIINDCYNDLRFDKSFDLTTGFHTRNMICVPMINKEELIGVIQVINKKNNEVFSKEDLQLFEALACQCAVAIENARLIDIEIKAGQTKHEMETAWKIQQRFLPEMLPLVKDIEMSIKLKPAKEIGGDYFNVIKIDENNTLFFIADVSGKSVPAALIVSTLYSFLQFYFIIRKETIDAKNFVELFNKFLVTSTTPDKFVTAWFGFYNHSEKSLISISAGHNPTYFLKHNSDSFVKLSAGGLIMGSIDFPYDYETVKLDSGDTIIFYTDGVPEAMNINEEEFGEKRFEELLLSNRDLHPNDLSKVIFNEIKKYRGEAEQSDDITLGILRIK